MNIRYLNPCPGCRGENIYLNDPALRIRAGSVIYFTLTTRRLAFGFQNTQVQLRVAMVKYFTIPTQLWAVRLKDGIRYMITERRVAKVNTR